MDLRQIETFIAIVETGSFSAAAYALSITQPTVSTHIKQLEDELGVQLINRTTKRLSITVEGHEFYRYAVSIARMVRGIQETFSGEKHQMCRIGASSVPSLYVLPDVLGYFHKHYPEIKLDIIQGDSESIIDQLLEGSVHMGIVGTTTEDEELTFERLLSDQLVIVTPNTQSYRQLKQQQIAPNQLLRRPLIMRESGSGTGREANHFIELLGLSRNELNQIATVNDVEVLKRLVEKELGISIVSRLSVQREIDRGSLLAFELTQYQTTRHFYLAYRKGMMWSTAQKRLYEFLRQFFEKTDRGNS
ncbi:selenium metabolism-associated LysR family transcriptional regulator [Atopobacter sp. AH10]|uniref:selenium metabolism-associated LysR family transcriptional regulator n=1 Tax=Atopobacter sp. AH10 TaxID=2315861 RepID=UPI001314B516|nr:selenium metabolism-associated LysR family transcriptional regulator [Atopobacter sp. AH10]